MPVLSPRAVAAKCQMEPLPALPTPVLPGSFLDAARNSSIVFQGASARTVIAAGSALNWMIGVTSSYENLAKPMGFKVTNSTVTTASL
ncbi:hypothetical protein D3C72_1442730 [compost metagenome]